MRSRWTCWLAALLLLTACGSSTPTKVVRTDGSTVIGALVSTRPDAIVLKTSDGATVTIPRSAIASIESASAASASAAASSAATSGAAASSGAPTETGAGSGQLAKGSGAASTTSAATRTGASSTRGAATATGTGAGSGVAGAGTVAGVGIGAIPNGTTLTATLDEEIGSDSSDVEDTVDAELRAPLIVNGTQLLPAGARLRGTITEATPSGHADGRGKLALRFDKLLVGDREAAITTAPLQWRAPGVTGAPSPKKEGGSFFKRVVSKTKKGLRIGDGDSAPATQGSKDVHLARGATLKIRLEQPVSLAALEER